MHRTKAEWADYSWNPITGCLKKCQYCIAKRRFNRFSGDSRYNASQIDRYRKSGELYILDEKFATPSGGTLGCPFRGAPTYHRYRLNTFSQLKSGTNILVCMDGEMFGPWVPDDVIDEIFSACGRHPRNHYLFLTRYPDRYESLYRNGKLPAGDAYWYGTTVTGIDDPEIFAKRDRRTFVAALPILGTIPEIPNNTDWVIAGGLSEHSPYSQSQTDMHAAAEFVDRLKNREIPYFTEKTLMNIDGFRQDFPVLLRHYELSPLRKEKLTDNCISCGRTFNKRDMVAIQGRQGRKNSAYVLCYICKDCFKDKVMSRSDISQAACRRILREDTKQDDEEE